MPEHPVGVREWLVAEIDRRVELCRAATPGQWVMDEGEIYSPTILDGEQDFPQGRWVGETCGTDRSGENAALIAAHDPSSLAALYEWMRGEVEKHCWYPLPSGLQGCYGCAFTFDGDAEACPFVAGLASALGYPGREEGESSDSAERGSCEHAPPGIDLIDCSQCPPAAPVQNGGAP